MQKLTPCQLSSLPDKISYSIVKVTSPKGFVARLPRRELFDVRLQLMAEDDNTSTNPLAGLDVCTLSLQ
jgi:protein-histidine N-methyltransferase